MSAQEITLTIKGFQSKAQVDAFVNWYVRSGEQDIALDLEIGNEDGKLGCNYMNADCHQPTPGWDGNKATMFLIPSE